MARQSFAWSRLPLTEAIAYFAQKQNVDTNSWRDVMGHQHQAAFVVAGAKAQILQDFRTAVDKALAKGTTLKEFQDDFDNIVSARGWNYNGGRDWRSELIYQTNMRTAYGAGRREQMNRSQSRRPYRQWRHGGSNDPRPEHLKMDGVVVPASSAIAQRPLPHGYGCKCTWFSLSDRDLDRLGLEVQDIAAAAVPVDEGWPETYLPPDDAAAAGVAQATKGLDPELAAEVIADTTVQDAIANLAAGPARAEALSDADLAAAGVTEAQLDAIISDPEQVELLRLAIEAIRTGETPSLDEVKGVLGSVGKSFIRNPLATIREGKAREKLAKYLTEQIEQSKNSELEYAKRTAQIAASKLEAWVRENPDQFEEIATNTGGFFGGMFGGIVGDLGGSLVVRKAIGDYRALLRAKDTLAEDDAYASAAKLSQLKILGAQTLSELKTADVKALIRENAVGDVSGWAIGNTAAAIPLPLSGAAVAMLLAPRVTEFDTRVQNGEDKAAVAADLLKGLAQLPVDQVRKLASIRRGDTSPADSE